MKRIIFIIITLTTACLVQAQVIISNAANTAPTNSSVSLEFGSGNRGLILPYLDKQDGVEGTVFFDTTDGIVKYINEPNDWFDLSFSAEEEDINSAVAIQGNDKISNSTSKVAIGNDGDTDATKGILVLTDTDKAMILPKVSKPHLNIINPSPGLIVFDTDKKQLVVFNGSQWSFWKPLN